MDGEENLMLQSMPIPKPAPAHPGSKTGKVMGTLHPDAVRIFIHEGVLEEVIGYSEREPRREVGGFLLGGWHEDRGSYVEVRSFLPALDTRSRAASLTFTHETWAAMHRDIEAKFPNEQVLGWQHTHPNFGVFLSAHDLFIHQNFFRQTWQIAMVVDPQRHEFGFFQWRGGQVVDCGFVCVCDMMGSGNSILGPTRGVAGS